jgi:RimJ/RimL family protein N-acetyltransferase
MPRRSWPSSRPTAPTLLPLSLTAAMSSSTSSPTGTAELGYRVAQHAAGRGVATATVRELCRLAAARHGLRTLKAATTRENAASQKVLTKAGFVPVGPADPAHLGGKPGTWYQRDLAAH